jgi:hypothetical protein
VLHCWSAAHTCLSLMVRLSLMRSVQQQMLQTAVEKILVVWMQQQAALRRWLSYAQQVDGYQFVQQCLVPQQHVLLP